MALFVDLTPLSKEATDAALEFIYKSHGSHGSGIWNPHETILIRRIVELFSRRGLDRIEAVKNQLLAWQAGDHFKDGLPPQPVPGYIAHWNAAEFELVKLYMESLPPAQWTIDDHMLSVEYVVHKYMHADQMTTEAEWLAVRAGLMGKVQASLDAAALETVSMSMIDKLLSLLPSTVAGAATQMVLTPMQRSVLEFGAAKAAENVVALTDSLRHQLRKTILAHAEAKSMQASGVPGEALQTVLFDMFSDLNRDWRRIAVTEAGEMQTQGFIASLPEGAVVKRIEQYGDACAFCKKIHERKATVVSADAPDKDGTTQIWVGKNNVGRSASPRKRVGGQLIPREEHELYWLPAGLAHPHCRGRWVLISRPDEAQEGDDPEFAKQLAEILS